MGLQVSRNGRVAETKLLSTMLHWNKSERGQREISPGKRRTQNGMLHPPASPWMIQLDLPEDPAWSKVSTTFSGQAIWGIHYACQLLPHQTKGGMILLNKNMNMFFMNIFSLKWIKTLWNYKWRSVLNLMSQHSLLWDWELAHKHFVIWTLNMHYPALFVLRENKQSASKEDIWLVAHFL